VGGVAVGLMQQFFAEALVAHGGGVFVPGIPGSEGVGFMI